MNKYNLSLLFLMISILGCDNERLTSEFGNANSTNQILVSGSSSAYKESVLKNAIEKFEMNTIYIRAIPIESLLRLDLSKYKAIILFNTCYAWNMQGWVYQFLENKPKANEKVIVFTTSASLAFEHWKPSLKVDAISSASKNSNIGKKSDELYSCINAKLSK